MTGTAPEQKLLEIIDSLFFGDNGQRSWKGSATDMERELDNPNINRSQLNKLLYSSNTCGIYLSRLADKQPGRVKSTMISGRKRYTIFAPAPPSRVNGSATSRAPISSSQANGQNGSTNAVGMY
jgi:hypothetical protein